MSLCRVAKGIIGKKKKKKEEAFSSSEKGTYGDSDTPSVVSFGLPVNNKRGDLSSQTAGSNHILN